MISFNSCSDTARFSMTATLNSYLSEKGYKKMNSFKIIEKELFELKDDNVGLGSFSFDVKRPPDVVLF